LEQQKIVLVTGAGSGIGKACAMAFSAKGCAVVLAGRRRDRLEQVASVCSNETLIVESDVADPESVTHLFKSIKTQFTRLDVLFNNAGGGSPPRPFEEIPFEEWQRVINVNLTGTFLCTQAAFGMMKEQTPMGGRIVNNGSISAHVPRPLSAPYTASKHGVTGLTRSTSLDGRPYNIVCSQIDIGNALTDLTARMAEGVPQPDGTIRAEPTMDVQHVADAIVQMTEFPLETNVQFMTIMATKMPFIGRG
tara:strand:- start:18315 stop:19061 length:747 start_codon:yes stop_codon:yes gene_type:complete